MLAISPTHAFILLPTRYPLQVVSWNQPGDVFTVHDKLAFERSLWAKDASKPGGVKIKVSSWSRQLNDYGFSKLRSPDKTIMSFKHKQGYFRRGRPDLLCQIKKDQEKDKIIAGLEARVTALEQNNARLEENNTRLIQVLEGQFPQLLRKFKPIPKPVASVPPSPSSRADSPFSTDECGSLTLSGTTMDEECDEEGLMNDAILSFDFADGFGQGSQRDMQLKTRKGQRSSTSLLGSNSMADFWSPDQTRFPNTGKPHQPLPRRGVPTPNGSA